MVMKSKLGTHLLDPSKVTTVQSFIKQLCTNMLLLSQVGEARRPFCEERFATRALIFRL
jgi:hypothetical protein